MSLFRLFLIFSFLILRPFSTFAMPEQDRDQLQTLNEWLPYVGCQDDKLFKLCYTVSTEECEGTVRELVEKSCLNYFKPKWMNPASGSLEYWKNLITECTYSEFKRRLKGREVESLFCQNRGVNKGGGTKK